METVEGDVESTLALLRRGLDFRQINWQTSKKPIVCGFLLLDITRFAKDDDETVSTSPRISGAHQGAFVQAIVAFSFYYSGKTSP